MTDQTEEYSPFGPSWVKQMMRLTKAELVDLLEKAYHERMRLRTFQKMKEMAEQALAGKGAA